MGKNIKKESTVAKIGKTLDMPSGGLSGGAHIELFSNREAVIDGIKGVIEYNDCYIKLNIGKGAVEFWGTGLEISSLDINGLVISGNISKIEFCI